jgi:hypothetical protein
LTHNRSVLLAIAFCCALSATAPADGTELAGGSHATIAWSADAPLPAAIEEWEAFLSVDGGRYYAMRITPHLDRDIRQFTFSVPNVTSHDARILLRFGDEERETEVELPLRLRIRYDPLAPRTFPATAEEEGEEARAGEPPVTMWVAGTRDGSHAREVTHRDATLGAPHAFSIALPPIEDAEAADEIVVEAPAMSLRAFVRAHVRSGAHAVAPRLHDPLLDTMRLNI